MASTAVAGGQVLDASNPAVARVRQLIGGLEYSQDGWSRCWEEGVTPWDLGQPTPAVVELAKSGTLPGDAATVLVPGCGTVSPSPSSACIIGRTSHAPPLAPRRYASCLALMWTQFVQGYDVVALSGPGRFVVGRRELVRLRRGGLLHLGAAGAVRPHLRLHILLRFPPVDEASMGKANGRPAQAQWRAHYPRTWLKVRRPARHSTQQCSSKTPPSSSSWTTALAVCAPSSVLAANANTCSYEEVLKPLGFVITCIQDNDVAVKPRQGMEKIARWKRMANPTNLDSQE
ncbi:probable thiol methyltransferase 2 isoform X1 [Panicum virgatum]|uniref:probable thiol methyltransferase 2 isoform X1 n=1 Tax=Panicum virgatum TaxID=38727 RepID=UPI0019D6951B|nr:probable thiol methyltransferase 2 isoform X1 [Panicum virgatum]